MAGMERIGLERTRGALHLGFALRDGETAALGAYQAGALRVRFPRHRPPLPLEAVILNTAGGLTGGDRLALTVDMGQGTRAVITSQACEKIYRASAGDAYIHTEIKLAPGSAFDWLPQPTILFDRANLRRETIVEMSSDSRLVLLESIVLGRTSMKEEVREGNAVEHWRVRRDGRLVYADTLRLNGAIQRNYRAPWALGRFRASAHLLCVAPDAESRLDFMRGILNDIRGVGAASAWNGLLSTRVMAEDGYTLGADLQHILRAFRGEPLPRLWSL